MPQDNDSGLVKRGFALLGLMALLVVIVLFILLRRPGQPDARPETATRPEHLVWAVVHPASAYPAGVSWGSLYQLGDWMPSAPGWEVRYNAAAALARHGSDQVPWDLIREMLDERHQ